MVFKQFTLGYIGTFGSRIEYQFSRNQLTKWLRLWVKSGFGNRIATQKYESKFMWYKVINGMLRFFFYINSSKDRKVLHRSEKNF